MQSTGMPFQGGTYIPQRVEGQPQHAPVFPRTVKMGGHPPPGVTCPWGMAYGPACLNSNWSAETAAAGPQSWASNIYAWESGHRMARGRSLEVACTRPSTIPEHQWDVEQATACRALGEPVVLAVL